jgi:hypothetical protein
MLAVLALRDLYATLAALQPLLWVANAQWANTALKDSNQSTALLALGRIRHSWYENPIVTPALLDLHVLRLGSRL